jgi:endonuclease YncB( thermonuclease family)
MVIKGTFRLVNLTKLGTPIGFEPDGDSIHFKPDQPALLEKLPVLLRPVKLSNIGSVQLRMEGIDALELHYQPEKGGKETHQPRLLGNAARDFLTGELGLNPVPYTPPDNLKVKPPVPHDATRGYILSRSLEVHGRPVSFVFAGDPAWSDGASVHLTPALLKQSANYKLIASGNVYPLFYDTLFAELRNSLAAAARRARKIGCGIWLADKTLTGVKIKTQSDLENNGVIFPKLFRRLTDFLVETDGKLSNFRAWLENKKEQVLDLTTMNFTHLDNIVRVEGNRVMMTLPSDKFVVISQK